MKKVKSPPPPVRHNKNIAKRGRTFLQLKKNSKYDMSHLKSYRLAVLGDHATQLLAVALRGQAYEEDLALDVFDADYNQIQAQIMDDTSELYEFNPDFLLISMCSEKLYESFSKTPIEQRNHFAENTFSSIQSLWKAFQCYSKSPIYQFTFAELDDRIFGSYATKLSISFLYQVKKLNMLLLEQVQNKKELYCIDLNAVYMQHGIQELFDEKMYYTAKMTISTTYLPQISKQVVDSIVALTGAIKKCVICDLDNTLWGGVIGDDGLEGIEIGELGTGHAFTDFQLWIKELKNRGIILAVCSKNEEATAKLPFEQHPEMVLSIDDISVFKANWNDKASNIREIQKILNIGFDSMVFLDDNIFERNAVRELIPEVCVPELPEDPGLYLSFLKEQNLFETVNYSNADLERTQQYQAEAERVVLQETLGSYDDYLKSLEMIAVAKSFDNFHIPRIAQLTQRSNQFNLRTTRYTEAQIKEVAENENFITLYFTLKDKFGDHGLISVVILEKHSDYLFIETWLMSCRVLKRGMEEFVVNKMVETAKENGFDTIKGEYIPTAKNAMVKDLFSKMGFSETGENNYRIETNMFERKLIFITE